MVISIANYGYQTVAIMPHLSRKNHKKCKS